MRKKSYKTFWRELKEYIMSEIIRMKHTKYKNENDDKYANAYLIIYEMMLKIEREL